MKSLASFAFLTGLILDPRRTNLIKQAFIPMMLWAVVAIAAPASSDPAGLTSSQANDQLLYFTSTSLLADDQRLVFLSDRTGQPNIFLRDLKTGQEKQLTFNTEGFLKSYVYFDGAPYRGLGRASVSLDAARGVVYFLQGRKICAVDTNGTQRVLAEYPEGQMTAFTHGCYVTPGESARSGGA